MIKNQILKKLNLQTEKFLKTPVDILISGAPGTGKTTWAKNVACRIGKAHRIFEGRGFSYEEFQIQVTHGGTDCAIIEDVEQLSFSEQSKLLLWLNHPDRKIRTIFTCRVDLLELVKKQNFRSDLFFKISVANLQLPGINEMKEYFSDLIYDLLGVYQILHNRSGISRPEDFNSKPYPCLRKKRIRPK